MPDGAEHDDAPPFPVSKDDDGTVRIDASPVEVVVPREFYEGDAEVQAYMTEHFGVPPETFDD